MLERVWRKGNPLTLLVGMQKPKWLSEEGLQIAEKGREVKGKRERERNTHLNAELQTITKRDKKSPPKLSMQRNRRKQ